MHKILKFVGTTLLLALGNGLGAAAASSQTNRPYGALSNIVNLSTLSNQKCNFVMTDMIYNRRNDPSIHEEIIKCRKFANKTYAPYDLSPFHLGVMANNDVALKALRQAHANMDKPDHQKFTPLHHAAMMGNHKNVTSLLNWGAKPNNKMGWGGTYADLLRFQEPLKKKQRTIDSSLFSAHTNDKVVIHSECRVPGVTYTEENVASTASLIDCWKEKSTEDEDTALNIDQLKKYQKYIANPTRLSIAPVDGAKTKMCGVFAEAPIKKDEIIAEYSGERVSKETPDSGYLWITYGQKNIDGIKYRSTGSMINAGFPNVNLHTLREPQAGKGLKGLPERLVVLAMRDIAAGEQLTISYGPTYQFKKDEFQELNALARNDYVKKNPLQETLKKLIEYTDSNRRDNLNEFYEYVNHSEFISYILCTESSLKDLAEAGLVSKRELDFLQANFLKAFIDPRTKDIMSFNIKIAKNALSKKEKENAANQKISNDKTEL